MTKELDLLLPGAHAEFRQRKDDLVARLRSQASQLLKAADDLEAFDSASELQYGDTRFAAVPVTSCGIMQQTSTIETAVGALHERFERLKSLTRIVAKIRNGEYAASESK